MTEKNDESTNYESKKQNAQTGSGKKPRPKAVERWEQIEKVKWEGLPRKPEITQEINKAVDSFKPAKSLHILEAIRNRSKESFETNPQNPSTHDNLMSIVSSVDLLRISYNKLSKNKGALTPGVDKNSTADGISETDLIHLQKELKSGVFKWKPVRRIYVEKPGKSTLRPLGIPDFKDRIVQNSIRMVLEAIYEPEFAYAGVNSGFRPNKSPNHSIEDIRRNETGSTFAIEGDIKGAYDNVSHEILIKIIRKRITDEKFIQLLYSGFKAGIVDDYRYIDTFLGVPQGGIASPILFNIYMNEFDKFILNSLSAFAEEANNQRTHKTQVSTEYYKLDSQSDRLTKKIRLLQTHNPNDFIFDQSRNNKVDTNRIIKIIREINEQFYTNDLASEAEELLKTSLSYEEQLVFTKYNNHRNSKKLQTIHINELEDSEQAIVAKGNKHDYVKKKIRKKSLKYLKENNLLTRAYEIYMQMLEADLKSISRQKRETPYTDINRKKIWFTYYRYADDWIILISAPEHLVITAKEKIELWLRDNLKLELSLEKTLITELTKQKARFLGFELFYQTNPKIVNRKDKNVTQRYRSLLQVMPDVDRLRTRFHIRGLLDSKERPRELGYLTVLEDHQIVEKYNQMMIGLGNYYIINISRKSALNYWHYILYYSCIKTLATKHNSSTAKIIDDYGHIDISNPDVNLNYKDQQASNKRIVTSYTQTSQSNEQKKKHTVLLNYHEFMSNILKLRQSQRNKLSDSPKTIDFDIFQKANWRTKFKTEGLCAVCGSPEQLESHHIRPLHHHGGKFTGYKGFDKLVAALGRKQVVVCKNCHEKITYGRYDGLALKDLFDVRLVAPEGLIKLNQYFNKDWDTNKKQTNKGEDKVEINPYKKTYYSEALHAYYMEKKQNDEPNNEVDTNILYDNENWSYGEIQKMDQT